MTEALNAPFPCSVSPVLAIGSINGPFVCSVSPVMSPETINKLSVCLILANESVPESSAMIIIISVSLHESDVKPSVCAESINVCLVSITEVSASPVSVNPSNF